MFGNAGVAIGRNNIAVRQIFYPVRRAIMAIPHVCRNHPRFLLSMPLHTLNT